MKNKLILFILIVFTATTVNSQTNRYSTVTTSSFKPMTDPAYYQALAKQKQEQILLRIEELDQLTTEALKMNIDEEFREHIYKVRWYLEKLDEDMSLRSAEEYINTASKLYNKSVRQYNKRLNNQD